MFLPWSTPQHGDYPPLPQYLRANGRKRAVAEQQLSSFRFNKLLLLSIFCFCTFSSYFLASFFSEAISYPSLDIFSEAISYLRLDIADHENSNIFSNAFYFLSAVVFYLSQIYVFVLIFLSILTFFLFGGVTCSHHFQTFFRFIVYTLVLITLLPLFQMRIFWNFWRYFNSPLLFRDAIFQDFFFLFQRFDTFFLFPPWKPGTFFTANHEVYLTHKKQGSLKTTSKFRRFSLRTKQIRFQLGKLCTQCDITFKEFYNFLDENKEHLEHYQTLCTGAFMGAPSHT